VRYGPALVRKAERILRNRDDAVDLVQGLFVELVHRGMKHVDLPYLFRSVTNRCLNALRDRRTRDRLLEREQPALEGPPRVRCDEAVIGLDLLVRLAARLDTGDMEVLVCRYVDEMTQEEVAEHLAISRKTVGKRLARIRDEVIALAGAVSGRPDGPGRTGGAAGGAA
jgi:RNA polymerase sigma-70 factor, ECF subfamily